MHWLDAENRRSIFDGLFSEVDMPWGKPVDIQLYGPGRYRVVTDTAIAAESLLQLWPEDARGPEYTKALQSCLDDLEGKPSRPREAFIKAAKAAGIMMRPSQR